MSDYKMIVYTDGACSGNQNAENYGGWGAVLVCQETWTNKEVAQKELYGSAINTTNNIMELTGTIKALQNIKRKDFPVEVNVDSNYVLKGITEWIHGWKKNGWKNSKKKPVENKELWVQLDEEVAKFEQIKFIKVKAHANIILNELADELANKGIIQAKEGEIKCR